MSNIHDATYRVPNDIQQFGESQPNVNRNTDAINIVVVKQKNYLIAKFDEL